MADPRTTNSATLSSVPSSPGRVVDLRTAALLAGIYGITGAAAAMLLVPAIAERTEVKLPLPTPVFAALLAMQLTVVYGLLAWAGLRMARGRDLEAAPTLTAAWQGRGFHLDPRTAAQSAIAGIAGGVVLVLMVKVISAAIPGTLPPMLHPPSALTALAASTAASFGEEILCRLFLLSAVLRLVPRDAPWGRGAATTASALVFGALHTPGMVMLYGGLDSVPTMAWIWVIGLNALIGVIFGTLYVRRGIGAAIAGHWFCDLVWHVASVVV